MTDHPALVTFAIPVPRPVSAKHRARLDEVLNLTLKSIFAQTDPDFRVLVGLSHRPVLSDFVDQRFEIVKIPGWRPASWEEGNIESGQRKHFLANRFAELGGGYLMFCDMDDFVSRNIVAHVRATMNPNGYAIWNGFVFNASENILAPYPLNRSDSHGFHHFCGSSLVIRLTPEDVLQTGEDRPLYRRTHRLGHHTVVEAMKAEGKPLAPFPFPAAVYVRNTGENLSDTNPDWRDTDKRAGLMRFETAILAGRLADDSAQREEFCIPARYPLAHPVEIVAPQAVLPAAPSLSVLICTHRRPQGLERLLTALVPQIAERASRELIVVNDGTHSEDYNEVISRFVKDVRYRALKKNVGIAEARNIAAKMARFDYLVFTDDDCEPPPFWLDWLSSRLGEHPELDVVAGTTRPLWTDNPTFFARVRAVHELIPTTTTADGTIIFPTAIVAIRRRLFEELGGFGFRDFPGAGEDTELATRLSLRGAVSVYDPAWFTRHEIAEGFVGMCRRYQRYGYANGKLTALTTSPVAHDYMVSNAAADWRTIWRWEYEGRIRIARSAHANRAVAILSATLACLVKMAYWRGVKDAFSTQA